MECIFNHISYLPAICTTGMTALQLYTLHLEVQPEDGSNCMS
jgi:hypothetical protein